jgi:alpha-ketoglutarate-dependent taurine dioxygenase
MHTDQDLARTIQDDYVEAYGKSIDDVAADARELLAKRRICLVRRFPTDPDAYLDFLGRFGTPLDNYASRSDLAKEDPHPQINRVKFKRKDDGAPQSVHYVAGALRPHSARSWYANRPAYFSMLMVEPGWRDTAPGERGESVVLCWNHLFTTLAERDGEVFEAHFARMSATPVTFQANNVREELSSLPLFYPLPDASGPYDVGVRLKQDMRDKVAGVRDQIPDFEAYQESLAYFLAASEEEDVQTCFPLDAGDMLLLDNNRFAHGRRKIVGERMAAGVVETNNRELWSVTVV